MHKVLLIIQREYLVRVKKKSFIVLTILVPLLFIGMVSLLGYLAIKGDDFGDVKKVEVVDESGTFVNKLANTPLLQYSYATGGYAAARASFIKEGYTYLLRIPADAGNIELLGEKKPSVTTIDAIENGLTSIAEARKLQVAGIDTAVLARAQQRLTLHARQLGEKGETDAQTYAAYAVGFLSAMLIYICLFVYGTQVMRGVIEEKVSRIVEVIISSVKPFQLMLGKIIGVGMVGLTQFVLWIVISIGLSAFGGALVARNMTDRVAQVQQVQQMHTQGSNARQLTQVKQPGNSAAIIMQSIESIPVAYTLGCFLFYFLFGYLLYSAIFAAVGSAVDNETETQQFVLPVTLPLIFTFALAQTFMINNPDSSLSVWLSMIPFTSPIAMMIRIPFGVPGWQLALSMVLMVLGFLCTTWVAARIYRVGILMYGKKASYKELVKWFMYRE